LVLGLFERGLDRLAHQSGSVAIDGQHGDLSTALRVGSGAGHQCRGDGTARGVRPVRHGAGGLADQDRRRYSAGPCLPHRLRR
ncbi:hypothetical protein BST36_30605, partial [Mycolicibacterium moriokaense]